MNIVFDIDGTICFDGVSINTKIKTELNNLIKIHDVYFATARPIRDCIKLVEQFDIEKPIIIGGNGSNVLQNEQITSKLFNCKKILSMYKRFGYTDFLIDYEWDYFLNCEKDHNLKNRIDPHKLAINHKFISDDEVIKIALLDEIDKRHLDKIIKYCNSNNLSFRNYKKEGIFEIVARNVDKFYALNEILKDEKYVYFGNDINDIKALENSNLGFIVGNDIKVSNKQNISSEELCIKIKELSKL